MRGAPAPRIRASRSACDHAGRADPSVIQLSLWPCGSPGSALFIVVVLAGLFGDQNPYRNIAPTLVWIIWWVGFAYVAAFVGDVWRLINPWRTVFDAPNGSTGGSRAQRSASGFAYPQALGAWPACLLLLAFSWTELVYPNAASPAHIAWLMIVYSASPGRACSFRPRRLAAAWRVVLAGVWHLRPLCPDRGEETAGCCCGLRRGAARPPPGLAVDDGFRAAAARERALRRTDRHGRVGAAGRRAARQSSGTE